MDFRTMEFHLAVTTSVGGVSTVFNGLFVLLTLFAPPDNLGMFRSQYYVGAVASFFFAATQTWSALLWLPNGTMYVVFSARGSDPVSYSLCLAAMILQFTMLSSNFAVRYAAVRGGWMRYYLTNQILFYSVQTICVLGAYIPPLYLMYPTTELRAIVNTTHGERFNFDFMNEFYFICSYDNLIMGSVFVNQSIFLMAGGFQAINLLIMLICGVITYWYISKNTTSAKLREINNKLLCSRILQACFSFMFLFAPHLVVNSSMLLRLDASALAPVLSSMVSFATLFNPFIEITQTPGYRKRIMRKIFGSFGVLSAGDITISTGNHLMITQSAPALIVRVK